MELISEFIRFDLRNGAEYETTTCFAKQENNFTIITYQLSDNDCVFEFSKKFNDVFIELNNQYFEKYKIPFILKNGTHQICCNTQSKLYDLVSCTLDGISRKIYLESILLNLLFQLLQNDVAFQMNCGSCSFMDKVGELDKIHKVRDFIVDHLDTMITIPQLAQKVGTNECYLKKGFKEVFGKTINEFVIEHRMEKAKSLLMHDDLTIAEVGLEVGYASTSSFSLAFKNYFGFPPSRLQRIASLGAKSEPVL